MDIKRLERLCRVDSRATRENPQNFRSDPPSAQRLGQFSNSSCNLALGVRIRGAQSFKSDKSVQMCCKQIFQAYLCKCLRNEGKKYFYVNLFSNSYFDHISNTNFKVVFNTKSFSQSKVIEKHKTVEQEDSCYTQVMIINIPMHMISICAMYTDPFPLLR